jgi:hypothetical protein
VRDGEAGASKPRPRDNSPAALEGNSQRFLTLWAAGLVTYVYPVARKLNFPEHATASFDRIRAAGG